MPTKEEDNLAKQLRSYQPVEGPTTRQLEWGLWWVEHRALLKRILVIILILINTGLWSYSLFYLVDYGYNGIIEDRQLAQVSLQLNTQAVNHAVVSATGARSLSLGSVQVFSGAGGTYDLAATLSNPNPNWYARFSYTFTIGSETTLPQHGFVMPGESSYLTHFLYAGTRPASARVQVSDIHWERVDPRETGSIAEFVASRTDISISNISFQPGATPEVSYASFTVSNDSAYNYWTVDLYLSLRSGSRLVGINKYSLERLQSGETRDVRLLWPEATAGGVLAIQPVVDVFDQDNYMPFQLGPGQIK